MNPIFFNQNRIPPFVYNKLVKSYNYVKRNIVQAENYVEKNEQDDRKIREALTFIKRTIIQNMFVFDFVRKEKMEALGFKRLSNASILHIILQIIAQLNSTVTFNKIKSIEKAKYIKKEKEKEDDKKDIENIIVDKSKDVVDGIGDELVFHLFDITNEHSLMSSELKRSNVKMMGNPLFFSKSYGRNELMGYNKKYKPIFASFVNKYNPIHGIKKYKTELFSRNKYNNICVHNDTEMWQLLCAAIFHCKEQTDYILDVYKDFDNCIDICKEIDSLANTLNDICVLLYNKDCEQFMKDMTNTLFY